MATAMSANCLISVGWR